MQKFNHRMSTYYIICTFLNHYKNATKNFMKNNYMINSPNSGSKFELKFCIFSTKHPKYFLVSKKKAGRLWRRIKNRRRLIR